MQNSAPFNQEENVRYSEHIMAINDAFSVSFISLHMINKLRRRDFLSVDINSIWVKRLEVNQMAVILYISLFSLYVSMTYFSRHYFSPTIILSLFATF